MHSQVTHFCLDQVVSLSAYVFEEAQHVHRALVFQLLQHAVNYDISSRSAHASAEKHK